MYNKIIRIEEIETVNPKRLSKLYVLFFQKYVNAVLKIYLIIITVV
jgi:hypothetical protein